MEIKVITFGVFDLFHFGHLQFLEKAKQLGTCLIVGVCSDELVRHYKGITPMIGQDKRLQVVSAIRYVDHAFLETERHLVGKYIDLYQPQILAVGEDWSASKIQKMIGIASSIPATNVIKRTQGISSQAIREAINVSKPCMPS